MNTNTRKFEVAKALYHSDGPLTSGDVKERVDIPDGSVDSGLTNLRTQGYADRDGSGGKEDPYRHYLTDKGEYDVASAVGEVDRDTSGLNALFDDDAVKDTEARAVNDGGSAPAEPKTEPSSGSPALGDAVFDVSYSNEEAVDLLMALGDADEPDFDTRRTFARSLVHEIRRQG